MWQLLPKSNPEIRGCVGMQILTEQLFNECLVSNQALF